MANWKNKNNLLSLLRVEQMVQFLKVDDNDDDKR
jgi:hypothetical protein